jgi:DNA/RNA-binding domain of Phe-tRNA-synthetase-like protein
MKQTDAIRAIADTIDSLAVEAKSPVMVELVDKYTTDMLSAMTTVSRRYLDMVAVPHVEPEGKEVKGEQ